MRFKESAFPIFQMNTEHYFIDTNEFNQIIVQQVVGLQLYISQPHV